MLAAKQQISHTSEEDRLEGWELGDKKLVELRQKTTYN